MWLTHGHGLHHLHAQNHYTNVLSTLLDESTINCGPLNNPENGNVTLTSMGFDGVATYVCNEGFVLEDGDAIRWRELAPLLH